MSWSTIAITAIVFVAGVTCSPIQPATDGVSTPVTDLVPPNAENLPTLATDLVPPSADSESSVSTPATDLQPPKFDDGPTLATDLVPPPLPEETPEHKLPATLFLINVFAVKNHTAEDSNDVLHNDVMTEVPEKTAEPLGLFVLVVEDDDEKHPVSLDEVAKDLEAEGFTVEKISKDGETRLVKVDLSFVETMMKVEENNSNMIERHEPRENSMTEDENPLEESGKLTKLRRKRHICLKCKLDELKFKKHGGGNGCQSGCGVGGGYYPPQQPIYQPVVIQQPRPQPHYPPQQPYCDPCQQGGGRYPQGGGSGYSQASAHASAQASAQSYGY